MQLQSLEVRNFKGIREFNLETGGGDVDVYGQNGSGKTTLEDAFLWLIFGKDSQGLKKFGIKPVGTGGDAESGIRSEVQATLIDEKTGATITLKKSFYEVWTKHRNSPKRTFDRHTTDHFVDGTAKTEGAFEKEIAKWCEEEEAFRLLTNPRYFTSLHWTKQRDLILAECGDVSEADVIAADPKLATIPEILGGKTLDDKRDDIKAARSEINQELDRIPVRIAEVDRGLPAIPEGGQGAAGIERLRKLLRDKETERVQAVEGGAMAEKTRQLKELEGEILGMENAHRSEVETQIGAARAAKAETAQAISEFQAQVDQTQRGMDNNTRMISDLETQTESLRAQWDKLDLSEFTATVCPTCEQDLPEDKVKVSRANFNQSRASALETIEAEAKDKLTAIDRMKAANEQLRLDVEIDDKLFERLQTKLQEHDAGILGLQAKQANVKNGSSDTPEYLEKTIKKAALEQAIRDLKAGEIEGPVQALADEIEAIVGQIAEQEEIQATLKQRAAGAVRIQELKAEQKLLAEKFEDLVAALTTTDRFIVTKVRMLDEKINRRYELVRFKLFNLLLNGGVEETCEVSLNGVPHTDMSFSEERRAGLDIIRTLSKHYKINCPVFLDNRESITEIPAMNCQVISLIVSEQDKTLRVVAQSPKKEERARPRAAANA